MAEISSILDVVNEIVCTNAILFLPSILDTVEFTVPDQTLLSQPLSTTRWLGLGSLQWNGDARERGHSLLGQTVQPFVAVPCVHGHSETGMEMERAVRMLHHRAVLLLDLLAEPRHVNSYVLH